jgi:hypothetical protein
MNSSNTATRRGIVALGAVCLAASAVAGDLDILPARALSVGGGLIAVRGGLMGDPSRPAGLVGKMRYPTLYFVLLKNETSSPVWAEVAMRLPDKKKAKSDFGQVKAGDDGYWRWPAYDAIWDESISIHISVYADEGRKEKLAEKEMAMNLDGSSKDLLYHPPKAERGQRSAVLISGWREMSPDQCKVDGTAADDALRIDICLDLWKQESVDHMECEHRLTEAKSLDASQSALLAKQPAEFRDRADAYRAKGDLILERWSVTSCDVVTPYEVMLIKSPQGGTDIMTAPLPHPDRAP